MATACAVLVLTTPAASAFWAGGNLPWVDFGYDVGAGSFDSAAVGAAFGNLSAAGANSVRFWLHADGRASPAFAADGSVTALLQNSGEDAIVSAAVDTSQPVTVASSNSFRT